VSDGADDRGGARVGQSAAVVSAEDAALGIRARDDRGATSRPNWQRQLRGARTAVIVPTLRGSSALSGRAPGFRARVVPPARRLIGPHIERRGQAPTEDA